VTECTGKVKSVVFSNKQTGFHVLRVVPDGDNKEIRVAGSFPGVNLSVGNRVRLRGKQETHPTYGDQLTASTCEVIPEKGKSGIIAYMVSQVPTIGIVTASRLYDTFGEDLVKILDSDPEAIKTCPFLNSNQMDSIISEWSKASASRNTSIYLSDLGLTSSQIKTVLTSFGVNSRRAIETDPYCLAALPGIGFITSDTIALKLPGFSVDSPQRVKGILTHAMRELSFGDGHMFCTSQQIIEYVNNRIFKKGAVQAFSHGEYISESQFYSALTASVNDGTVTSVDGNHYLAANWENEAAIARSLGGLLSNPVDRGWDTDAFLAEYEAENDIQLAPDQRRVFDLINQNRVITVTGYPGTGKTTLIRGLVELFERNNKTVALMSPTGIAAKRLSQVTGRPASTIHRALGFKPDEGMEFNATNRYCADIVIVDEMSMVDSAIFSCLTTALHPSCSLVMVGDTAQLPSVGAGFVLDNLTRCTRIPHVSLTKIYRQGKTSDIITVAHAILNNTALDLSFNRESEFVFLSMPSNLVVDEICKLASKLKISNKNFQVIAPKYDGELGVNALNNALRQVLNPASDYKSNAFVKIGDSGIYEGDRVMVVKNDYQRGVFNGDVGKVVRISLRDDAVDVKVFGVLDTESTVTRYVDKVMTYKVEEARQMLKVAYACTAHKVQGQEFDYVIMPMNSQYGVMLYKNLVYTAITRAKQKVFVFGDPASFTRAIMNERDVARNSDLARLTDMAFEMALTSSVQDS